MPTQQRYSLDELAQGFREANPDAAHLGDVELLTQAFEDHPDVFDVSDDGMVMVTARPTSSDDWQEFSPEQGSLGIPRASMPQIKSEQRGAMVNFMKARGITHSQEDVAPNTLKPSQAEYSPAKVEKARGFDGSQRSILVSSDNHVIDGHHQWLSALDDAPDEPVPAIRLNAPAQPLLLEAARFPSSGVDDKSAAAVVSPDAPVMESNPEQWDAAEFAAMVREANPQAADISDDDLLAQVMEENPDQFARSNDGSIMLNQQQDDGLLKRSTPMPPKPAPHVGWGRRQQERSRANMQTNARRRKLNQEMTHRPVEKIDVLGRAGGAVNRAFGDAAASNYSTLGNVLEPLTWVDKGWRGLLSLVGVKSGEGPAERGQRAARENADALREGVAENREASRQRNGGVSWGEDLLEGGVATSLDFATKYSAAGKLIKMAGGEATAANVMTLVNGVDNSDKGTVATALGMGEGYLRGRAMKLTENQGPLTNLVAQGGGSAAVTYARTGDAKQAASDAVLQGVPAMVGAKGSAKREAAQPAAPETVQRPAAQTAESGRAVEYSYVRHPDGVFTIKSKDASGKEFDVAHAAPAELAGIVGEKAAQEILKAAPRKSSAGEVVQGIVNVPRSVVTSFDLSAAGRQGVVLAVAHPVLAKRAFTTQLKALGDGEYARAVQTELTTGPRAERRLEAGLYLPDYESKGQGLNAREEAYQSQYAEKIPGVKQSERAYLIFLNKLRSDTFDKIADANPHASAAELKDLAKFINVASGRGDLGRAEALAPALTNVFFSPRLLVSRIQTLAQPVTAETAMGRKVAATELTKFFGGALAMLGAAKAAGADVGIDPRSTDFGKIKVGRTRIDIFGGFQQIARTFTQDLTGQAKTEGGEIKDINRGEYALRFGRSKLSPQAGLIPDVLTGEDLNGKPVTAGSVTRNLIEPLAWRDIEQAVREDLADGGSGLKGAALGSLGMVGVGVQTYEKKPPVDEVRRLKLQYAPRQQDDETDRQYVYRVGRNGVAFGRVADSLINSDAYQSLPDDAAKKGALSHVKNAIPFMIKDGLKPEAVDHNALVVLEESRLATRVDRSDLPDWRKARLREAIKARLKYTRVFADDRRRLADVQEVFERQRSGVDEWLQSQMAGDFAASQPEL